MDYIKLIEKEQLKTNLPSFKSGDTIRLKIKVIEGGKERIQTFEGICIEKTGGGINENFTLRKISYHGVGVERTFPLHSPRIQEIQVIKRGDVKKSKLYYLRKKVGKQATKVKEKRGIMEDTAAINNKNQEASAVEPVTDN